MKIPEQKDKSDR